MFRKCQPRVPLANNCPICSMRRRWSTSPATPRSQACTPPRWLFTATTTPPGFTTVARMWGIRTWSESSTITRHRTTNPASRTSPSTVTVITKTFQDSQQTRWSGVVHAERAILRLIWDSETTTMNRQQQAAARWRDELAAGEISCRFREIARSSHRYWFFGGRKSRRNRWLAIRDDSAARSGIRLPQDSRTSWATRGSQTTGSQTCSKAPFLLLLLLLFATLTLHMTRITRTRTSTHMRRDKPSGPHLLPSLIPSKFCAAYKSYIIEEDINDISERTPLSPPVLIIRLPEKQHFYLFCNKSWFLRLVIRKQARLFHSIYSPSPISHDRQLAIAVRSPGNYVTRWKNGDTYAKSRVNGVMWSTDLLIDTVRRQASGLSGISLRQSAIEQRATPFRAVNHVEFTTRP